TAERKAESAVPTNRASGTRDASCQLRTVRQQRPAQPPGRGSKVVPGVESVLLGVVALYRPWQRFCEVFTTMKTNALVATCLTAALSTAGYAQTPDKAKLDQFLDRLAVKHKAMGSLVIAKDGNVLGSWA